MVDSPFLAQIGGGVIIPIPPVPPEDFSSLEAINRDIMASVERYRQTNQAPRDGDFYAHLSALGLGTDYDTAVGQVTRTSPGQSNWRAICTVSALRLEAQIHASRGRFLRELKFYEEAKAEFSTALSIYNALLSGSPVPPRGGDERQLHTFARTINGQIRTALASKPDIMRELRVERAEIQVAMLCPDDFVTDEMIYRPLAADEFRGVLDRVTQAFAGPRGALDESIRNSVTRSHVAEASFLLELAKRLKVRNQDQAHTVVDRAIEICLRELNAGHGDNEVRLSALLTLAWAYNTKASLLEEKESGTGREFALKAAAIYTFLLFGQGRIANDEDLRQALEGSPELQALITRYGRDFEVISRSLASVLRGGSIITSGIDILQRNATNELELYLNLANALSLARKFDGDLGALTISSQIRQLEGRLNRQVELRDSFFYRARLADANIQMAHLSRLYGETRDLSLLPRFREIETDLQTTLSWFSQKINGLQNAGADIKQIDQYSLDFLRGYDTLAWVYSTLGRIEKNEQGIWDGLAETDYLALAENYYQALRLQDNQEVAGDDFATLANRLCRLMRGFDDYADRLIKMEIETYITWPQVYLHQGELNRELENYEIALEELSQITVDDASYYSTQLSIAEIKLVMAQRVFTQTGDVELALQNLGLLLSDPTLSSLWSDESTAPPTIRIRAHLLAARLHEALGRLTLETMDRAAADRQFDQALALYDELIAKEWIHELMTEELFITVDQLRLARAEVLKARGERDLEVLAQAEAEFAVLSFAPASLRGMEAELSQFEMLALRNKYYITQGLYHDIPNILTAEQEARLEALAQTLTSQGANRLAYRALSVYAWLINQRARIAEVTSGEGSGREDYLKAAALYTDLMANPLFSDNRFLHLLDTSRGQIMLAQAESLKSASVRETDLAYPLNRSAEAAYAQALSLLGEIGEDDQLYYLTSLSLLDAQSGRAENRITLGKLQEEEGSLNAAEASYREALGYLAPVLEDLVARPPVRYLTESRMGLRATSALTWVLNSLGEWRENSGFDVDIENAPVEYRTALLIFRALVIGDSPAEWLVADEEIGLGVGLGEVLGFIRGTRSLTDDEVLFAAEQSRWAARFGYLAALNSSKMFGVCLNVYSELVRDIEASPLRGIFELEYAIRAHALMGDVNTFRLASDDNEDAYDAAEEIYKKALALLNEYLNRFHLNRLPREMEEARQYINSGYAKVLIEGGHFTDAEDRYLQILRCPFFLAISRELESPDPDWQRIRQLRGTLTFKQFKILVQTYLGLGNLYTHYLREVEAEEALRYFEIARQLLEQEADRAPVRRMRGETRLGMGNVYLLRFRDYEQALTQFSEGVKALTGLSLEGFTLEILDRVDRKSRMVLVRLLIAASTVYAKMNDREETERLIGLARATLNSIPEDPYEPDRKEIREQLQESTVGNAEILEAQALSVEPYAGYRRTAFESQAAEGFLAGFLGHASLTPDLTLDFGYANVMSSSPIPLNDNIDRLTFDRSHQATLGLTWQAYEGDNFTLRLNPRFTANFFDYRVNQCNWGASYSACTPISPQDFSLYTYNLGLGAELFWNTRLTPDLTLVWGGGLDASFLIRQGMYPSYQAQITSYEEQISSLRLAAGSDPGHAAQYEQRAHDLSLRVSEVEDQNDSFLFSFLASPRISLVNSPWHISDDFMMYYPTFTLGGLVGYDPISVTEQGRWPLAPITDVNPETGEPTFSPIDPFRWAVTAGFHTTLAWGDEMQYRLPITTNFQVGNFIYFDINAGFNFGLDWFNFMAGYSHYQDDRQNVVDNLNLGLRFLLPWF